MVPRILRKEPNRMKIPLIFCLLAILALESVSGQPGCPPATCCADIFEVNDDPPQASTIGIGVLKDLTLCNSSDLSDFYNVTAPGNGLLIAKIQWGSKVDLDLGVFDPKNGIGFPIVQSQAFQETPDAPLIEYAAWQVLNGNLSTIRVKSFSSGVIPIQAPGDTYNLTVEFHAGQQPCSPDKFDGVNVGFGTAIEIVSDPTVVISPLNLCDFQQRAMFRVFDLPPSGLPYEIRLNYVEDGFFHPIIQLQDDVGQIIKVSTTTRSPTVLQFNNLVTTTYFIQIQDEHAWFGTYSLGFSHPITTTGAPVLPATTGAAAVVAPPDNVGVIVGASIGALVFVFVAALIVILIIVFVRRRSKPDNNAYELEAAKVPSRKGTVSVNEQKLLEMVEKGDFKDEKDILWSDIEIICPVGAGNFGQVFKAQWREIEVAVKKLSMTVDEQAIADFKREAKILKNLRPHPNVVLFLGVSTIDEKGVSNTLALITEFCENGSLYKFLKSSVEITPAMQYKMLIGIARGMYHLHSENIIHRDLAARNILLTVNFDVKVSDFGLSRQTSGDDAQKTKAEVGPIKWMAPESITKSEYSPKSDVFSYAVLMWEICAQNDPWPGITAVAAAGIVAHEQKRMEIPPKTPKAIAALMTKCWAHLPQDRPDFKQICVELAEYSKTIETGDIKATQIKELSSVSTTQVGTYLTMGEWEKQQSTTNLGYQNDKLPQKQENEYEKTTQYSTKPEYQKSANPINVDVEYVKTQN